MPQILLAPGAPEQPFAAHATALYEAPSVGNCTTVVGAELSGELFVTLVVNVVVLLTNPSRSLFVGGGVYVTETLSPYPTVGERVSVTIEPEIETFVTVTGLPLTVTANAVPAGTDPMSSDSSKWIFKAAPFTSALVLLGGVVSVATTRKVVVSSVRLPLCAVRVTEPTPLAVTVLVATPDAAVAEPVPVTAPAPEV